MNSFPSNASEGKAANFDSEPSIPEKSESLRAESACKYDEWAENWLAGNACCPQCGRDDMQIVRTRGDGSGRIEDWRCPSPSCRSGWRVELRESALGIYRDTDGVGADWYERTGGAHLSSHLGGGRGNRRTNTGRLRQTRSVPAVHCPRVHPDGSRWESPQGY